MSFTAWKTSAAAGVEPWQFQPETYGAVRDGQITNDVATTSLSASVTSPTIAADPAAAGKHILINGGNGTTSGPVITTIQSVSPGLNLVTLNAAAGATASGCVTGWGTDDTSAVNSALAALKTYALANDYFGELSLSAGIYVTAGALIQSTSPQFNTQIQIPYPDLTGAGRGLTVSIQGAGAAGDCAFFESTTANVRGTSILSMQTAPGTVSPTFGEQSVIGGPSAGGAFTGGFANTHLWIDGVTIWHGALTNMYDYDFGYLAGVEWGQFSCKALAPANTGTGPLMVNMPSLLTSTIGVGCRFPLVGNNDDVTGASFAAEGIGLGFVCADHFTAARVATVHVDVGGRIDLVNGISGNGHAVTIANWSCENYNGGLSCNGGGTGYTMCNITLDTEPPGAGDPVFDISDNGNLYGQVIVGDAKGRTIRRPVVQNGAPNLEVINAMMGPGPWLGTDNPAVPAVPASGTSQQNTSWRPAIVAVTGGTVSAVSVNGQPRGFTATPFTVGVPAGGTITLTYTAAPAWTWTRL